MTLPLIESFRAVLLGRLHCVPEFPQTWPLLIAAYRAPDAAFTSLQHALTKFTEALRLSARDSLGALSAADRARLASCSAPHASAIYTARLDTIHQPLSSEQYAQSVRHRLGLPPTAIKGFLGENSIVTEPLQAAEKAL
jgi:hypothetical protein